MAEVLSQSQIDALLNAANKKEEPAPPPSPIPEEAAAAAPTLAELKANAQEQKYRKYDFYSPRKFTKDRLRIISSVFENYARLVNSRINGVLHTSCEITVETVEEQRYYEFSNAISENDVLSLIETTAENSKEPDDSPVIFHYSTPLMLSMMDRLMGGLGDEDPSVKAGYIFTDLELKLYESLAQTFTSALATSWENYINIDFVFQKAETNPTLVQLIGLDETIVIVGLDIKFENCTGHVNIVLPGMMLTNIFTFIAANNKSNKGSTTDNADEIMDMIKASDLEIIAELSRTRIQLSDLNTLHVGDVIDLSHPTDAPVNLYIGNKTWFSGKLGTQNKSIAVKIFETHHNYSEESEEG